MLKDLLISFLSLSMLTSFSGRPLLAQAQQVSVTHMRALNKASPEESTSRIWTQGLAGRAVHRALQWEAAWVCG